MSDLQSGITLTAIMDGATINGYIKVLNTPLIQRYTKGTNNYVPDFETLSDGKKPVVAVILRDSMSGEVIVPNSITFKYNGIALSFGSNNLCTTQGFEGVFKKITNYPVPMGTDVQAVNMTVLQVVKNLVPLSSYDNDVISASGNIEIEGQTMAFAEVSAPVVIHDSTGNPFDVVIEDDNGGCIDKIKPSVTLTAKVYRDGVAISDLQGLSFKWFKMTGTGDVAMSSQTNTQRVTKDDVDDTLLVRCDVYQNEGIVASGYRQIRDYSDNYFVTWNITDSSGAPAGTVLKKGNIVKVTPVAVSREDGSEKQIAECSYKTLNNKGQDFIIHDKDSATFPAKQPNIWVEINYDDLRKAGYGLHIRLSGTL